MLLTAVHFGGKLRTFRHNIWFDYSPIFEHAIFAENLEQFSSSIHVNLDYY